MNLTITLKLLPNQQMAALLESTMQEYIALINDILDYAIACGRMPKLSSANLYASLPSALKILSVHGGTNGLSGGKPSFFRAKMALVLPPR